MQRTSGCIASNAYGAKKNNVLKSTKQMNKNASNHKMNSKRKWFIKDIYTCFASVPGISLLLVWMLCVRKTKGENWKGTIVKSVKMWASLYTIWPDLSPSSK